MMGLFNTAKAQISGQKALRVHLAGNRLCDDAKPKAAMEKYREALGLYEQALAVPGQKPNVYQGYAILLLRTGDFERARDVMQQMRGLPGMTDNDWFQLRVNYSVYLWKAGELEHAIETIGRAAKEKMNSTVYTTMGIYLVDQARRTGDFTAVEDFNRQAMDYDDEDAGTLDNMGAMYEAMMDFARAADDVDRAAECRAKALQYYKKAHEQKPRQITSTYALARMLHEDGDDAAAREVLEDADDLFFSAICPVSEAMMEKLKREIK